MPFLRAAAGVECPPRPRDGAKDFQFVNAMASRPVMSFLTIRLSGGAMCVACDDASSGTGRWICVALLAVRTGACFCALVFRSVEGELFIRW